MTSDTVKVVDTKEGELNLNPWRRFEDTHAALISLVLTGGFSVYGSVATGHICCILLL